MDLNYEKPAVGILKIGEFDSSRSYRIDCQCGSADDTIYLDVEADSTHVYVAHYVKVKSRWWTNEDRWYLFRQFWLRLKQTYNIWFRGYLEYEAETLMSEQQAYNYAHTILEAVKDVKQFRQERQSKS
jgi:hypothetical protein